MQIRLSSRPLGTMKVDLAVCFAYEGDGKPRGVEGALARDLARQMKADGFAGKPGERLVWTGGDGGPRRVAVVGLGRRRADADRRTEALRLGAARAVGAAADLRARSLGVRLPPVGTRRGEEIVRAAAEGLRLGAYRYEGWLTDPDRKVHAPERAELASDAKNARRALKAAEAGAGAVCLARDLVNEPPSDLNPPAFARRARAAAREAKLTCRVLGAADLKREKMQAMLAVARGRRRRRNSSTWPINRSGRPPARRGYCWSARASRSTPAGSTSSRRST